MEPKNKNIANTPEVTNSELTPDKSNEPIQPKAQPGDKPGTHQPRGESAVLPPGSPLSNDIGNLDMRVVPPYQSR